VEEIKEVKEKERKRIQLIRANGSVLDPLLPKPHLLPLCPFS